MSRERASIVTVMGLFRSGTNFLRAALEWNCECSVRYNTFGWKHGYIPVVDASRAEARESTDLVAITKDPFASIHSIYRYYRNAGFNIRASRGWPAFLRSRIVIYDHSQKGSPEYRFQNPVQLWNDLNWNITRFRPTGYTAVHVRYVDLLVDPQATLTRLTEAIGLDRKTDGDFELPDKKLRRMDESERSAPDDYVTKKAFEDGRYYRDAEYLKHYDADDIRFVLENLDEDLVHELGYTSTVDRARALAPQIGRRSSWARLLGR